MKIHTVFQKVIINIFLLVNVQLSVFFEALYFLCIFIVYTMFFFFASSVLECWHNLMNNCAIHNDIFPYIISVPIVSDFII